MATPLEMHLVRPCFVIPVYLLDRNEIVVDYLEKTNKEIEETMAKKVEEEKIAGEFYRNH